MNIAPKSTFALSRRHLLGIEGLHAAWAMADLVW